MQHVQVVPLFFLEISRVTHKYRNRAQRVTDQACYPQIFIYLCEIIPDCNIACWTASYCWMSNVGLYSVRQQFLRLVFLVQVGSKLPLVLIFILCQPLSTRQKQPSLCRGPFYPEKIIASEAMFLTCVSHIWNSMSTVQSGGILCM